MTVDKDEDLQALKEIGRIVRETIDLMQSAVRVGITTQELDDLGARFLEKEGARSAPQITYDFPSATCISVNDAVAHGIADDYVLADGDIVNIDVSAAKAGFFADSGRSMTVGTGHNALDQLCRDTETAMRKAVWSCKAGRPMNVVGKTVEREAEKGNYNIIAELCGHGVGASIHEEPQVYNTYHKHDRTRMHHGLVLTIEPFFTRGCGEIYEDEADGWTLRTTDGSVAAQFEHTFVVTKGQPIILT